MKQTIKLSDNKKIIVSKKVWNRKDRLEICLFRKKDKNWMPTTQFINVDFINAKEIYKKIGEVLK